MSVHDVGGRRRFEDSEFTLRIYPGVIAEGSIYCPIAARKITSAAEVIEQVIDRLQLDRTKCYVLAEVKEFGGEEWILNPTDCPVQRMMLWPRMALENRFSSEDYRFLLREKNLDGSIHYGNLQMWLQVTEERRRMVERGFLPQPLPKDFDDLCNLPDLNEKTLLDNLRSRFKQEKIYTYVGSILIVINPFKFLPIYNPKYVKMYDNHQLGKLEPHIYAVADVAYHAMLQSKQNQCIVISGESGSGKTQSTNFLIHHLTALSQKGFASGVEQIILGAGPVLEAFGNAKTAHNNNSSRFGKFIQVNYQESGTVRGAYVEKYLLEKSRLVYQEHNERNYHVFYYLLAGASEEERTLFHLKKPEEYHYLNQDCFTVEGEDLKHDFERLQLAMEMVGFLPATRKQIFSLLSAILHLGNIRYKKKIYRDDSIDICNPEVLPVVSELLEVKEEMLFEALTTRKTVTVGEKLIVPYKLAEAGTVRDSMAKSLYSALFDWIVFRINHALLNQRDLEESILSIGVLDIFGFEDYENNSFEQFCINFANERLQHYFNQHIFKLEQEEYRSEDIAWHNIDYIDNTGCINLISKKPTALLHLLDEECNFPQATNQTLLDKFKRQHEGNSYIEFPAVMEPAFIIKHYAGKVKYGVKDFREKNTDHMRPDIVALLKSSKNAFICGLIGIDPVATFRWAVLRAYFRAMVAFRDAGKRHVEKRSGESNEMVICPFFLIPCFYESRLNICLKKQKLRKLVAQVKLPLWLSLHTLNKYVNQIAMFRHLLDVKSLKYLSNLTLHDRITKSLMHLHKKKKPPSISAQFQASLNKLMETLGQSEPYFVKCIRSNAEKLPLRFNDALVLRQLRYTGMLETVRIRQSGYSIKYTFKDFVRHFHVLLPEGTNQASQEAIRRYLHQVDLTPEGFQVGRTMVFLRETERQRLQDLLHQEVLRRIINLQRRFKERRRLLLWREAALVIQRTWRQYWRGRAACRIQTAWRRHRARELYLRQQDITIRLQAAGRGYLARRRYDTTLSKDKQTLTGAVEVPGEDVLEELVPEMTQGIATVQPASEVTIRERPQTLEDPNQRTRAKRESRRMRELEQAKFSLELLKVRSTGGVSPSEERRWSMELVSEIPHTPQGTPDSQSSKGSFELLNIDDYFKDKAPCAEPEDLGSPSVPDMHDVFSNMPESALPSDTPAPDIMSKPAGQPEPPKMQNSLPTFYSPPLESSSLIVKSTINSATPCPDGLRKPIKDRKESTRRPMVVVISMQKESLLNEADVKPPEVKDSAAQTSDVSVFHGNQLTLCLCLFQVEEHNGHIFKSTQYSIPTYCEYCSSLIWMMDKACVCKRIFLSCFVSFHVQYDPELSSRQFGVELSRLTNDERAVPLVVEKLINYIEMHGLYTEGIYRKSGSTNKIKELKQGLDTDVNSVNLDDYNINVIASVFKQWLRDLPNPLMTFELYEEFLRVMGKLDLAHLLTHLNTLERLIFHLVRIALQEETNRMSANALAIVFAPCILRCPDTTDPLRSVQDIGKTTACVELIICEQMNKYKARLKDISTLEFAENKAKSRLTFIRRSMVRVKMLSRMPRPSTVWSVCHHDHDIQTLEQETQELRC
uniref:Myosin IXAa n=1 Tax=Cyprinus carpio TaxID=7962 RepID=A0A8C1W021_CYPCA